MSKQKLEPRLEKMLMCQTVGQLVVAAFASVASVYLCGTVLGWTILSMVAAALLTWFLMKLGVIVMTLFFQIAFYKGDYAAMLADANKAQEYLHNRQDMIIKKVGGQRPEMLKIIKTDEAHIGTFQDEKFYDWIEVMGKDGRSYRFNYFGCMDLTHGQKRPVPDDCLMIPPGIIYQVAPEINTAA